MLPALLQDQQPASVGRLVTKYDRVAETTTVQCDLPDTGASPAKLSFQANASFQGEEPNESAKFWLSLSSNRGRSTRHTQPLFRDAETLYLAVDSTQLEIPVKDYRNNYFEIVRLFGESARAEINREDLRKLLEARSLAGKWGGVEFKFSDAALASLKEFISSQVFTADTR